jgi:hypothetical protein
MAKVLQGIDGLPEDIFLVIADYILTPVKGILSAAEGYKTLFSLAVLSRAMLSQVSIAAHHIAKYRKMPTPPAPWTDDHIREVIERGNMKGIRQMTLDLQLHQFKDDGQMWGYAYRVCYPHTKIIAPLNLKLHVFHLFRRRRVEQENEEDILRLLDVPAEERDFSWHRKFDRLNRRLSREARYPHPT